MPIVDITFDKTNQIFLDLLKSILDNGGTIVSPLNIDKNTIDLSLDEISNGEVKLINDIDEYLKEIENSR